jgi:ribosomal protein S12 methylthiotransferase
LSKVGFVSLGCPKALVDSELILTRLSVEGYEIVPKYHDAEIVVVNTCGFIDSAVKESLDTIGEALAENGRVIVTGCLGANTENDGQNTVLKHHPKVLAVTGPHATNEVLDAIHEHLPVKHDPFVHLIPEIGVKLTPKHYAYLKISEGCNHRCTFCIIPSMRGDLVSRPIDEVLTEAQKLFQSGVKELLVVSQDTSAYGVDIQYRTGFWQGRPIKSKLYDLTKALKDLAREHDAWVRLHYVYPYPHVDDIIPLMSDFAEHQNGLLPYLDIPLQHANPDVLRRMKRPAGGEKALARIQQWREICPDITIRSTFIAGFPGETEEEFEDLLTFIQEARLDRVGCFAYSPVKGAQANDLSNPIPEDVREARKEVFMKIAEEVSTLKLKNKIGQRLRVLVDSVNGNGGIGRTFADAPEIDGLAMINLPDRPSKRYRAGEFIRVTVLDTQGHDLIVSC